MTTSTRIMAEYGYQDFTSQPEHFRFLRWLYTRAWWSEERLTVLFDLAMARLIDRKVLLPGVSVLERLISSVREHASRRLWQVLAAIPTPPQRALLETLLDVPPGERQTPLDRLRHGPTRVSSPVLVAALRRVEAIRLFEMEHLDLSFVPKGRLKALARHATTALVQHLRHLAQDRRIATLLAFISTYLAVVHDDALDLFDVLMRTTISTATGEGSKNGCAPFTIWMLRRKSLLKPAKSSLMRPKIQQRYVNASTPVSQLSTCELPSRPSVN